MCVCCKQCTQVFKRYHRYCLRIWGQEPRSLITREDTGADSNNDTAVQQSTMLSLLVSLRTLETVARLRTREQSPHSPAHQVEPSSPSNTLAFPGNFNQLHQEDYYEQYESEAPDTTAAQMAIEAARASSQRATQIAKKVLDGCPPRAFGRMLGWATGSQTATLNVDSVWTLWETLSRNRGSSTETEDGIAAVNRWLFEDNCVWVNSKTYMSTGLNAAMLYVVKTATLTMQIWLHTAHNQDPCLTVCEALTTALHDVKEPTNDKDIIDAMKAILGARAVVMPLGMNHSTFSLPWTLLLLMEVHLFVKDSSIAPKQFDRICISRTRGHYVYELQNPAALSLVKKNRISDFQTRTYVLATMKEIERQRVGHRVLAQVESIEPVSPR